MGREEEKAVLEVLRSKSLFRYYGPDVQGKATEFERRFAARTGTRHALATNSGTSALKCALFAVGVGPGDEVLVPAFSYVATADVVLALGATPVFVEIDESMTMDPADLRVKLAGRTGRKPKAICVVHLFGVAADLEPILKIAGEADIPVVEDCAQSCGAMYRGKTVGQLGALGIFSFQLNKVITAGEGGAVVTDDATLYDRAIRLHDHGNHRGDEAAGEPCIGEGFRIGELSAAILLAQLGRLDDILSRLRQSKRFLVERLAAVPGLTLTRVPDPEGDAGVSLTFLVDSPERATRVVKALTAEGIRVLQQYGGKLLYHAAVDPQREAPARAAVPALGRPGHALGVPRADDHVHAARPAGRRHGDPQGHGGRLSLEDAGRVECPRATGLRWQRVPRDGRDPPSHMLGACVAALGIAAISGVRCVQDGSGRLRVRAGASPPASPALGSSSPVWS
jgi:8-amino-3,8-dideoxy-alpha-D-manno-octulosonate transaminase